MNYDRNFTDWVESKDYGALLNKGNIAGQSIVSIVAAGPVDQGKNDEKCDQRSEHRRKVGKP